MHTMIQSCNESSVIFEEVKERIMRQTLEALFYEEIMEYDQEGNNWYFYGTGINGNNVNYSCKAAEKWSFSKPQIEKNSIQREGDSCTDIYLFLEEVIKYNIKAPNTSQFTEELLATLEKDNQSKQYQVEEIPEKDIHYEALESHMIDGHPYHPSYKSRIGFSMADNFAYGPEFNQDINVYWIAVAEQLVDINISKDYESAKIIEEHMTKKDLDQFNHILKEKGCENKEYHFMPVHPWQLENKIQSLFIEQIMNKDIVILGVLNDSYRAQQSIRSLSHRKNELACYIKFPLSIINTSTSRILAHHTTQNAPLISDWLYKILKNDATLGEGKVQILREVMGLSFRYDDLQPVQYGLAYGSLGVIFRENVSKYVSNEEEAWPLNAISHIQKNGTPFLQTAIDQYGMENWSHALLEVVIRPIIHLLYRHGIALESHAQNIILVVEDNFPKRIILKDLHDGVRYHSAQLLNPELKPKLYPEPESHRKFNRYSFLEAESAEEVRDYTYDAFFFICLSEICFTLESFGLKEQDFWYQCVKIINQYQDENSEIKGRFSLFDLFSEDAFLEEMTKRRIFGDGQLYFRKSKNPLQQARSEFVEGKYIKRKDS